MSKDRISGNLENGAAIQRDRNEQCVQQVESATVIIAKKVLEELTFHELRIVESYVRERCQAFERVREAERALAGATFELKRGP